MIETYAPGKLFIAGEYAVVTPGEPAVLVAINRGIRVRLTETESTVSDRHTPHVAAAIAATEALRQSRGLSPRTYRLHIDSELESVEGTKYGLGSSAAVTVAVVQAVSEFYGLGLSLVERFRLALLATITVSPQASGGDLAASTFGGWVFYRSPDRGLLATQHRTHGVASALLSDAWQGCEVRPLAVAPNVRLLVGWTGSPASTSALVDQVHEHYPDDKPEVFTHSQFLDASRTCVDTLVDALESGSPVAEPVRAARKLLQQLGEKRGIDIETAKLRALCEIAESHGLAAKPSGAGGGDCGIVLVTPEIDIAPIVREWTQHEIKHIDLDVHRIMSDVEGGPDEC